MFSAFDLELNKWFATGSNKTTWEESAVEVLQFLYEGIDVTDEEAIKVFNSIDYMKSELSFFNVEVREHDEEITDGDVE
ncbi:MAG: hypothetical protein WC307_06475 [Candidatus Nanoarchaeia archaeon]|jgi:hypothetical protein